MAMITTPGGELLAAHKQAPSTPPQLAAGAASAALPQRRPAVTALPGEIDITNSPQVRDTLTRALASGATVLVADGSETTFCDCSGVGALLLIHHQANSAGAQLRIVASRMIQRILALTGADDVLDIYATLTTALTGPSEPGRQPPPLGPALHRTPGNLNHALPAGLIQRGDDGYARSGCRCRWPRRP
jgi:anti-anti-sigma factor